jgi:hypothetical protein
MTSVYETENVEVKVLNGCGTVSFCLRDFNTAQIIKGGGGHKRTMVYVAAR